jgi:hypothetical protein
VPEHFRHRINLSNWFAQVYDPKGVNPEPMFRRRRGFTDPVTLRTLNRTLPAQ